ncbi:hypothetical protein AXI59_00130 [Bacillus nakamurai]|uniref:hypothetical protein n=1 Tax=Bacillus nakamurai TaxID=1793963 RepID=UPI000778316E|nr:hypothetical protein [Bacillus nakamurai]KXZ24134.1 hypothetical protein AXI59_00130 [Bacillus nakamurai]
MQRVVSVYIEPIMNEKRKYYKKVKDCPGKGEAVISVSSVKDRHYVFMTDSETFGDWPAARCSDIERELAESIHVVKMIFIE